ncbi:SDR family oxidoreductase [Candidatus Poriferisodalis sp.]|uniref:SDR family oxidoreductase n=1 Tax=Candidatus Poriferisodalis sp. TaxID=3101277 RepID=UPI003B01EAC5
MPPNMLEGKRIVVTGAGAGIGAAIADTARRYGAQVFGVDIDRSTHADGYYDVADEVDVARLFEAAASAMGGIDGLVNNVGIAGPTGRVEDLDPSAFDDCVQVNVGSTFRCTAAAVPLLGVGSSIVNIVSTAGIFGYPLRSPYAASKWAVVGLTKTWAMELGERGIRVNAVCPGTVEGPRMDGVIEREAAATGTTPEAIKAGYTAQVSLHTLVTGADIGEACCWLLSDAARYVSGQILSVDGNTETLRTV